jgi:hypothetical protein
MRRGIIAALAAAALAVACQPAALTDADRAAIEEEITQLYAEQAEMIGSVDMEGWLAQFDASEEFVLATGGTLVGYSALDSIIRGEWPNITEANFAWGDLHIRVLSRDLAVVSAPFEWSGVVAGEEVVEDDATWTVVLGKKDGAWKMLAVAESKADHDEDDED